MIFFDRFKKNKTEFPPVVDLLKNQGFIEKSQIKDMEWLLGNTQMELEDVLLRFVPGDKLLFVKRQLYQDKYEPIQFQDMAVRVKEDVAMSMPEEKILENGVVCLYILDGMVDVAMTEPDNEESVQAVEAETGKKVGKRFITLQSDIRKLLKEFDEREVRRKVQEDKIKDFETRDENGDGEGEEEEAQEQVPTRKVLTIEEFTLGRAGLSEMAAGMQYIVDAIIKQGLLRQASDIHIEPTRDSMKIRYRVDGILTPDETIDGILNKTGRNRKLHDTIVNIIKNRSGESGKTMRLDETGKAQDGRIYIPEVDLDLRVSVVPTILGESVVIRIHYREIGMFALDRLGFEAGILNRFRRIINAPYGILFVSGPTGSGKTTTIYSVLQMINDPRKKTLTIEDPVEYSIPNANQSQINPAKGFTFDEALRSFLRHDPDIIMVGEIRDVTTATMAMEAALTGHLVLSSVHANNAVSTITRLKDLGVDTRLITATCLAALGQRLVRTVCPECGKPFKFSTRLYNAFEQYGLKYNPRKLIKGSGCQVCNQTGYRGRVGIYELLPMTYDIKEAILGDSTEEELFELATKHGMMSLLEAALRKVARGMTTEEEVWRVTLIEGSCEG